MQSCTLGSITKEHLLKLKEDYPSMFLKFFEELSSYQDFEFDLRRQYIRNVPYLRKVSERTISRVLFGMTEKHFEHG